MTYWKLAATPDSDHGDPHSFFGPGVEGIADEQTDPFLVDLANRRKKRFSSSDSGLIIGAYVAAEAARAAGGAEDDRFGLFRHHVELRGVVVVVLRR